MVHYVADNEIQTEAGCRPGTPRKIKKVEHSRPKPYVPSFESAVGLAPCAGRYCAERSGALRQGVRGDAGGLAYGWARAH